MKHKVLPLIIFLLLLVPVIWLGYRAEAALNECVGICTTKQIGRPGNLANGNFVQIAGNDLSVAEEEYWIKLTAQARTDQSSVPTTMDPGADIMLIMDVTGSMGGFVSAPSGGVETRLDAAKRALTNFVSNNGFNSDYRVGFGTFSYCRSYNTAHTPIAWAYEGQSTAVGDKRAFGALITPMTSMTNSYKNSLSEIINGLSLRWDSVDGGTIINFCNAEGPQIVNGERQGTPIGAGLTIANSQLTDMFSPELLNNPIFGSQLRGYLVDSAGRRNPAWTNNQSPYRGNVSGTEIPKFLVLFSDGEENVDPKAEQEEIDQKSTRIKRAKDAGVRIYTVLFGGVNTQARDLLKEIASDANTTYFESTTGSGLDQIYGRIREDIKSRTEITTSTSIVSFTMNERLSTQFAEYYTLPDNPSYGNDFRVYIASGGSKTYDSCGSLAGCGITNVSSTGFTFSRTPSLANQTFEIWFKVKKTGAELNGRIENVGIDNDSGPDASTISYAGGAAEPIAQKRVNLVGSIPYFVSTGGGNVFSQSSIISKLPAGVKFLGQNPVINSGILYGRNINNFNFGVGVLRNLLNIPPGGRVVALEQNPNSFSYQDIYNEFERLGYRDGGININALAGMGRGFYVFRSNQTMNTLLNYPNTGARSAIGQVVFVDGDLYITQNITVAQDGNNAGRRGVVFIVSGKIGIAQSVTRLDGFYMADGVIDTVCVAGGNCAKNQVPGTNKLSVQGGFFSNSGIFLDRAGADSDGLGEEFVYRPDLLMFALPYLGKQSYVWQEIEP